eukprot:273917-Chlamydomonas_euryale.AAC.5
MAAPTASVRRGGRLVMPRTRHGDLHRQSMVYTGGMWEACRACVLHGAEVQYWTISTWRGLQVNVRSEAYGMAPAQDARRGAWHVQRWA